MTSPPYALPLRIRKAAESFVVEDAGGGALSRQLAGAARTARAHAQDAIGPTPAIVLGLGDLWLSQPGKAVNATAREVSHKARGKVRFWHIADFDIVFAQSRELGAKR